jgi:hypothetical protein
MGKLLQNGYYAIVQNDMGGTIDGSIDKVVLCWFSLQDLIGDEIMDVFRVN